MKGAGMAIDLQFEANKALNALNSGQFNPALKTARAAIKAAPREAFFHNIAGLALSQMGKERDAIPYFQKAVALDPAFLEAQRNMAQALFMLGKFDRVHSLLDKLLVKNPNDNDALYLMAMSKTKEGDFKTAEAFATRAIETGANVARSLNLRAIIRKEIDNLGGAIDGYETSLALVPDNPDTLSNYSFTLALKGRSDEALAVLNKALEIAPDHLGTLIRIGGLLNEMGRKDESKAMFQRALAVAPEDVGALTALTGVQDQSENVTLLPMLKTALSRCPKGSPERTDIAFALWNITKHAGDLAEAEKWLVMANKNAAQFRPFDIRYTKTQQDKVFARFEDSNQIPENIGDSGPMPIFVLGLIRSGTTLTEQIISSHSTVYGAGELATAGYLYSKMFEGRDDAPMSAELAQEFAKQYRRDLPEMPEGTTAFVDKMPGNFGLIGLLLAAFPSCKIINLVRDPRDTALSAFSNNFPAPGLNYTYDLRAIATQFNFYRETINRWDAMYPGRILHHRYADMVSDIDASSRRLAEFCGLEWEPAMTRPQDNKRAVMTASVNQVRQGVHTKSLAGWKRHEAMLAPLIEVLDPALWPEMSE